MEIYKQLPLELQLKVGEEYQRIVKREHQEKFQNVLMELKWRHGMVPIRRLYWFLFGIDFDLKKQFIKYSKHILHKPVSGVYT